MSRFARYVIVASLATMAGGSIAIAAIASPGSARENGRKHRTSARKAATGDGLERFVAFRRAPATTVPEALRRDTDLQQRFGVDLGNARTVRPPDGDASHPWYLLPGKGHVCYFDGGGGGCSAIDGALKGGLTTLLLPNPPLNGAPTTKVQSMILQGIVPDGVSSVRAVSSDGQTHEAPVVDGAYSVSGQAITSLVFVGDDPPAPLSVGK